MFCQTSFMLLILLGFFVAYPRNKQPAANRFFTIFMAVAAVVGLVFALFPLLMEGWQRDLWSLPIPLVLFGVLMYLLIRNFRLDGPADRRSQQSQTAQAAARTIRLYDTVRAQLGDLESTHVYQTLKSGLGELVANPRQEFVIFEGSSKSEFVQYLLGPGDVLLDVTIRRADQTLATAAKTFFDKMDAATKRNQEFAEFHVHFDTSPDGIACAALVGAGALVQVFGLSKSADLMTSFGG